MTVHTSLPVIENTHEIGRRFAGRTPEPRREVLPGSRHGIMGVRGVDPCHVQYLCNSHTGITMRSFNLGTQVRRICYPCCRHVVSEFRVHFWLFFSLFSSRRNINTHRETLSLRQHDTRPSTFRITWEFLAALRDNLGYPSELTAMIHCGAWRVYVID